MINISYKISTNACNLLSNFAHGRGTIFQVLFFDLRSITYPEFPGPMF